MNLEPELSSVFIYKLAYPLVQCKLRLSRNQYAQLEKCLKDGDGSGREFIMCKVETSNGCSRVGTLLRVLETKNTSDGNITLHCIGKRRMETDNCSTDKEKDFFHARVTSLSDCKILDNKGVEELNKKVYLKAQWWWRGLPADNKKKITDKYGDWPKENEFNVENGPAWLWWVLAAIPIKDDNVKLSILGNDSLENRLEIVYGILCCLPRQKPSGLFSSLAGFSASFSR